MTTPEEQAAEVLARAVLTHRFWYQDIGPIHYICWCGEPGTNFLDREGWAAHVAEALAPLFAEERRKGAEEALRWVALDPRIPPGEPCRALLDRADTYAEGGEHGCAHEWRDFRGVDGVHRKCLRCAALSDPQPADRATGHGDAARPAVGL